VTYLDTQFESSAQKNTIKAHVHIDGVGSFSPAISTYPNFADGIGTPSVKSNPVHDWYVTLVSAPTSGTVTIVVQVGTLVMWLWIGGLIMALGTAVALVPMRKRRVVAREPATPVPDPEPEILVDAAT
jgi:cytochrome c-type biogenesis protein CcmF